jgi:3-hydroxybutyrate dehydrogenase
MSAPVRACSSAPRPAGIGLGIAKVLAARGARVCLNGLGTADAIAKARAEVAAAAGAAAAPVEYHPPHQADAEQIAAMMQYAETKLGRVDVLVNNAGVQHVAPIEAFPRAAWDRVLAVNLTAAFLTTQAALPGMRRRGFGRIMNIASAHGQVGSVHKSAYVASKHGLVGLTKVTALETAGSGITANAVSPGWVLTPLVQAQIEARAKERRQSVETASRELLLEKQPSGQFVLPEQLGAMVAFLATDAAAQVTGTTLNMDGGWTCQ